MLPTKPEDLPPRSPKANNEQAPGSHGGNGGPQMAQLDLSRSSSIVTSRAPSTVGDGPVGSGAGVAYSNNLWATSASGLSYHSEASQATFVSTICQEKEQQKWDSDEELKRSSKILLKMQKWSLLVGLSIINVAIIWVAVQFPQSYYFTVVLLTANTALQALMIIFICTVAFWTYGLSRLWRDKPKKPETPETMVWLLPCYNETLGELTRSLDSLVAQKKVDENPKFIMIVVDGNVRGPGMEKTTQRYLLEDILGPGTFVHFENGYRAHDGLFMAIDAQHGTYKGVPYLFVGKRENMGKRDSLCFTRSFLHHYNRRSENLETMYHKELFEYMGTLLMQRGIDKVDYLAGMDADTVFDDYCIHEMLEVLRADPKLVASCGHVCVDYADNKWGAWSMYQAFEYSQTQGLRRTFQSVVTGKVNCLPGCCQLIKVCEETFGDLILREKFGYCPKPNDPMTTQIMGTYSEDSVHATTFFSLFPETMTAQALRAKAFTIVPQDWKVFLSQRKRWSLGSISNQFTMVFRPGIMFVERIISLVTVITWAVTPFTVAAIAHLVIAIIRHGNDLWKNPPFLSLFSVLVVKYIYSLGLVFWLPRNATEQVQYVLGYIMHIFVGPFINLFIWIYSLYYSDDFKWGKTREIIGGDEESGRLLFH
ncbi:chitin synthase-domain-containing protein [Lasiosphaeria ovina]|uniref:chitin synthase n=1 Tax=Lasiosphaeria ovina TaxID=92902 RepID=A0AAE0KHM1_9PEZI|nr:chitin synthase-domain-containing protein [Lasiosphaeria ovina]